VPELRRLSLKHLPPLLFRYADASQLLTQGTNKLRVVKSAGVCYCPSSPLTHSHLRQYESSDERVFKFKWEVRIFRLCLQVSSNNIQNQVLWKYDPLTNSAMRYVVGPRHVGDPGMYSYSSKRLSYVDCVPEHRLEKYIKHGRPVD
jgi:hypothetical protein